MTFITLGFKNNVITDGTFITLGFKCYYMMGPLLHLGPVITLVPSTYQQLHMMEYSVNHVTHLVRASVNLCIIITSPHSLTPV